MPATHAAKVGKWGGSLTVIPKGRFLVFLRERDPGRTQKEVEDGSGIPNLRLSTYERGKPICIDHLEKLAAYYGMPARELTDPESWKTTLHLIKRLFGLFDMTSEELTGCGEGVP